MSELGIGTVIWTNLYFLHRDGPQETVRKLGVFTEGEPNDPPSSTSNQILVRFRSNSEKRGLFKINYQGTPPSFLFSFMIKQMYNTLMCIHCTPLSLSPAYRLQFCLPPPIIPNAEILMASKEFKIGMCQSMPHPSHTNVLVYSHAHTCDP